MPLAFWLSLPHLWFHWICGGRWASSLSSSGSRLYCLRGDFSSCLSWLIIVLSPVAPTCQTSQWACWQRWSTSTLASDCIIPGCGFKEHIHILVKLELLSLLAAAHLACQCSDFPWHGACSVFLCTVGWLQEEPGTLQTSSTWWIFRPRRFLQTSPHTQKN